MSQLKSKGERLALLALVCGLLPMQCRYSSAYASGLPFPIANTLHLASSSDLEKALVKPFPDTYQVETGVASQRSKATINTCAEYLALPKDNISTGSSLDDRTLLSLGVECVALDWIRHAPTTSAHTARRQIAFRQITVGELPPELSLALSIDEQTVVRKASKQGKSILAVDPLIKLRRGNGERSTLLCPDYWKEELKLYAQGDFLGDGSEQLLVRTDTQVIGGSYTAIHLILLELKNGKFIVVRTYPLDYGPT